ncbi:hypothetical protein KP509_1Z201300 [Ceratopteris richardii]|nr:hypothetical protein KP509_1Z201300 [Ceratopteris richardii]
MSNERNLQERQWRSTKEDNIPLTSGWKIHFCFILFPSILR